MPVFNKRNLLYLFIAVILAGTFYFGVWVGKEQKQCRFCAPEDINFSLFWDAYHRLQEKYVDTEKLDNQKIIYGAISGMVKSLEDPYTVFFPPEETKKFMEEVSGTFEGIGIEIDVKDNMLQVIAPLEGMPAEKAGIKAGDKILKINDKITGDISIDEAINLIRGKKGTEVTLTIFRDGWKESKEIKIVRDLIIVPSVKLKFKDDIAIIKISQFSEKAGSDFNKIAYEVLNSSAKKIIIDLRNNPGGYLEVSQDIAGWFLEKGQIVVVEDFGGKAENNEYLAQGNGKLLSYPTVILIDGGSASASEILAGALKDNRNIKLIGEKSFGKGSVQQLENFEDGSSLKITIAKWLTPKGKSISEVGLEPDIKAELTEDDYNNNRDPQLDKAVETVNNL